MAAEYADLYKIPTHAHRGGKVNTNPHPILGGGMVCIDRCIISLPVYNEHYLTLILTKKCPSLSMVTMSRKTFQGYSGMLII